MKRSREDDETDDACGTTGVDVPGNEVAGTSSSDSLEDGAIVSAVPTQAKTISSSFDHVATVYGDAVASVTLKPEFAKTLKVGDVSELVTWVLTPDGGNPAWAFVRHKPKISRIVMVLAPGLCENRCANARELMPNIANFLGKGVPTNTDNGTANELNVARTVLNSVRDDGPNNGVAKKRNGSGNQKKNEKTEKETETESTDAASLCVRPFPFPPTHYVLSAQQMVDMDYPTPVVGGGDDSSGDKDEPTLILPDGFVVTQPSGAGIARSPALSMVALDCEMCYVGVGVDKRLVLTRCSVVGPDGTVVYDKLVMPSEKITDYNTAHSGITESQMRGVTVSLEDVQRDLLELISCETVLCGHSLENDLRRLQMMHPTCVDTVLLYPHDKGPPYRTKLSSLTEKFLRRKIQQGSHDSVADARATMELALLKFVNGPKFGEPIGGGGSLFEYVRRAGKRCAMVDRVGVLEKLGASGVATRITTETDTDAVEKIAEQAGKPFGDSSENIPTGSDFVFGTLYGYYEHLQTSNSRWCKHSGSAFGALESVTAEAAFAAKEANVKKTREAKKSADADADADDEYDALEESVACDAALADLDTNVKKIWTSLPTGAMLILVTGVGNSPLVKTYQERKWKRAQGLGPWGGWTEEAEHELRKQADRARRGMVFAAVKGSDVGGEAVTPCAGEV